MTYKFFKYILPALAIFSILIYLGGNSSLYENFSMNFLNRISTADIKNPATDFADLLEIFDKLRNASASIFHPNDIFDFFSRYWDMFLSYLTLPFNLLVALCKIFYDVVWNLIEFIRVIIDITGIDTLN